jgi:hypothetical protein
MSRVRRRFRFTSLLLHLPAQVCSESSSKHDSPASNAPSPAERVDAHARHGEILALQAGSKSQIFGTPSQDPVATIFVEGSSGAVKADAA